MPADTNIRGDAATRAVTWLGAQLLQSLTGRAAGQNVVISPTSIVAGLAMVHHGASGHTRDAIARVLSFSDLSDDQIDAALGGMIVRLLAAEHGLQLFMANGLWVGEAVRLSPVFIEKCRALFQAEVSRTEDKLSLVPAVNGWVNRATHGKIPRIIERDDDPGDMLLVNAIYFKGLWANAFERRLTEPGEFHLRTGAVQEAQLMTHWGRFNYFEDDTMQAIRLPYQGGAASMAVILPREGLDLVHLLEDLTPYKLNDWLADLSDPELHARSVHLQLPRFRLEYDITLDEPLAQLGMGLAFDPRHAEFAEMCPSCRMPLYLGLVRHKASLEVNEEGTEAAAATSSMMRILGVPALQIVDMSVDRPFLVAIRDDRSGALLFTAAIFEP